MAEDHDDELLNTLEAARVLGVDRDKVYRLIHGCVLPARKYGRTFRLRRGDVKASPTSSERSEQSGHANPLGTSEG